MKKILLSILIIWSEGCIAQVPEDALRYSWYPHNGTARNMAVGGVMGSLGGDLTAVFVNPAGLGFYKTNEAVLTPGLSLNNNKISFRETETAEKKDVFSFGPTGVILALPSTSKSSTSSTISFAINQTANFNNTIHYQALNNYSSFSEQFAEEFAKSGQSIDDVLFSSSSAPYSSAPALYTYLIDTLTIGNVVQVRAAPENILDAGQALRQDMVKSMRGGIYEPAIAFAQNIKEKWLWGVTLGIPIVYYKSNTTFTETDTSANSSNGFKSFSYNDQFKTAGAGGNLKLGVIYRPKEYIRLGLAIHTPSFMTLTDTRTVQLDTQLESDSGTVQAYSVSSNIFTNNQAGESKYFQTAPWKAVISGSWVFRETENVKKQRAFVSADIEYVNHRSSRFSSNNEEPADEEIAYYKSLNKVVKQEYRGTFDFRAGGEVKFNTIMGRLGFAYYGNPYKDKTYKANRLLLSGGLGYRNKGFFVDLTYVYNISKDVNLPYRLEDRANTFAAVKNYQGNVIAGVGVKF